MPKPKVHLRLQDEDTDIAYYPCGVHRHWTNDGEEAVTQDTVHVSKITCLTCLRYAKKVTKRMAEYENQILVTASPENRYTNYDELIVPTYGPHLDLRRRVVDPKISPVRALNYPTRRYTSIAEIEVGDIVRCIEDDFGNPAFDDCIISAVSLTHATLQRPHMVIRGLEPVVEYETYHVGKRRLYERFTVVTHNHSGRKDNRRLPELNDEEDDD